MSGAGPRAAQGRRALLRRPPAGRPLRVKMILPALTEADSPYWRPIKYSLFPPLGPGDAGRLPRPDGRGHDSRTSTSSELDLDDDPDLVVDPGLHHLRLPGLRSWPTTTAPGRLRRAGRAARDLAAGRGGRPRRHDLPRPRRGHLAAVPARTCAGRPPSKVYRSAVRTLAGLPPVRRDLIKRHRYLVPNSIVVSRGCPHPCDFCYKEAFFRGGKSFYTQRVDDALAEIERLPGRHLYFLDDHLLRQTRASPRRSSTACAAWAGSGRRPARSSRSLPTRAAGAGRRERAAQPVRRLRDPQPREPARSAGKRYQNLNRDYAAAVRRLHDLGVMVNASFVFGMDDDDATVFDRTVEWAIAQGIETATFHILTPYPGTRSHERMAGRGARVTTPDWDLYDTRHVVFQPAGMTRRAARGRLLARLP